MQRLAATEAVRTLELGWLAAVTHRSSVCTEWIELIHVVEHIFWITDSVFKVFWITDTFLDTHLILHVANQ